MALDAIRRLIEVESFGGYAGNTGILDRSRVNDDEACPFQFFNLGAHPLMQN